MSDELTAPHPCQKVVRDVTIHDRRRHTVDPFPIWSSPQQPRQLVSCLFPELAGSEIAQDSRLPPLRPPVGAPLRSPLV